MCVSHCHISHCREKDYTWFIFVANIVSCTVISLEERKLVNNINNTTCSSNTENAFVRIGELICFQTKELGKCIWTKERHNSVNVGKLGTHELTLRRWCGVAWRTTWGTLWTESQRWRGAWTRQASGPFPNSHALWAFLRDFILCGHHFLPSLLPTTQRSRAHLQLISSKEQSTCDLLAGSKVIQSTLRANSMLTFLLSSSKKDVHTEN